MKKVVMYIVDVLLWILAYLLKPLFTVANYFFVEERYRYAYRNALAEDIFGNVHFAPMLNKLLITKDGYKFGNQNEYISEVLGRNIIIGNTLTSLGEKVVKFLSPSHCLNAIQTHEKYIPVPDETISCWNMTNLINIERMKAGLHCLTPEVKLNMLAKAKAQEMAYFNKINHYGFDKRVAISQAQMMVENVCYGYSTEKATLHAYMQSEGHRANILNQYATHIGVATVNDFNCVLIANY